MKNVSIITVLLLGFLPFSTAALADERPVPLDAGTFSFQLENDLFSGTDRHYTNGIKLSWLSPSGETFPSLAMAGDVLESLPYVDAASNPNRSIRLGFSLGQDIYTPEDRYTPTLITDDRPYGAWLYSAVSLHAITDFDNETQSLNSVELALGVVGPIAFGEQAQDIVHDVRLIDTFEGWDNQLGNELGFTLRYENKWRLGHPLDLNGLGEFDMIPHVGVSLGNISTQAGLGGAVRWGWNLPHNFGPPSLIHGGAPFLAWERENNDNYSAFLFATAGGSYVAHNIFLDGNTFKDSHSVDRKPFIGDLSVGASLLIGPVNLSYTTAYRSREFEGQDRGSRYGSISLSMQNPF